MNKIISQTFTYDLPDDYLLTTNNLKKTGTWTYNGPDKIWVFVNKETLTWKSCYINDFLECKIYDLIHIVETIPRESFKLQLIK